MRDEWVRFAAAGMSVVAVAKLANGNQHLSAMAADMADAMMVEYVKRFAEPEQLLLRLPEPAEWTWGEVEIFGRRSHLGRYRWTAGERFLDVEELIIERVDGIMLVERIQSHRYGAKAIFSVSARPEADIRKAAAPYEPDIGMRVRGNASDPPPDSDDR